MTHPSSFSFRPLFYSDVFSAWCFCRWIMLPFSLAFHYWCGLLATRLKCNRLLVCCCREIQTYLSWFSAVFPEEKWSDNHSLTNPTTAAVVPLTPCCFDIPVINVDIFLKLLWTGWPIQLVKEIQAWSVSRGDLLQLLRPIKHLLLNI